MILAIVLGLVALGLLAGIVRALYRDDDGTRPADHPAPTPPAAPAVAPAPSVAADDPPLSPWWHGAHAAPVGRAAVPGAVPVDRPEYVGRHDEDSIEMVAADYAAPLFSPAFAAVMGYDRPDRRVAR